MDVKVEGIEGRYVLVRKLDGNFVDLPISLVPEGVKIGDTLSIKISKGTQET